MQNETRTPEDLIGKKVKIKCPVFKKGNPCFGVVTGIKVKAPYFTTMLVKVGDNTKSTAFAIGWLTVVEQ